MYAKDKEGARAGLGAVEGAVFALLGLLIAFTFSGAAARFDARRELIVQEANAIGTAWSRVDLLPTHLQPGVRDHGFALIMATAVYVILDLEFPRIGLSGVDSFDPVLYELRQEMG